MDSVKLILCIEDNEADFQLVHRYLSNQMPGCRCVRVDSLQGLKGFLGEETPDLVLSDYRFPGMDFRVIPEIIQAELPYTPLIVLSGRGGKKTWPKRN